MIFNGTKTGTVTYKMYNETDNSYVVLYEGTYEVSENEITATLTGVSGLLSGDTKTITFYTSNDWENIIDNTGYIWTKQ